MWHVTCDTWQVGGGEPSLKFQLPSSYGLGVKVFWRYFHKESHTELSTKVFVELPWLHQVSYIYFWREQKVLNNWVKRSVLQFTFFHCVNASAPTPMFCQAFKQLEFLDPLSPDPPTPSTMWLTRNPLKGCTKIVLQAWTSTI